MNKELLTIVSQQAIELGDFDFSPQVIQSQWLGHKPASIKDISTIEERLGIKLPSDYFEFLKLSNGFAAPCATEPTFISIDAVDYLKNIDPDLIEIWKETGNEETADLLHRSILVGGLDEEQQFLLIPPITGDGTWLYWKFAHWIPGEEAFESLDDYFEYIVSFIDELMEE